jgi:hypothetical protein
MKGYMAPHPWDKDRKVIYHPNDIKPGFRSYTKYDIVGIRLKNNPTYGCISVYFYFFY